jgi:hypothetical protein
MAAMRKCNTTIKKVISLGAALGAVLVWASAARADHARHASFGLARADGEDIGFSLQTEVECYSLSHAGRVRCVVHLRPVGGTLHFSDVIVLSAPKFAPAVRDRVMFRDAQRSDLSGADLPLTLTATGEGEGELYVMGRATVCADRGCRPVQGEASVHVVVGAPGGAP